jgi:hypothetical protein
MMDTLGLWVRLHAGLPPTTPDLGDGKRGMLFVGRRVWSAEESFTTGATMKQEVIGWITVTLREI